MMALFGIKCVCRVFIPLYLCKCLLGSWMGEEIWDLVRCLSRSMSLYPDPCRLLTPHWGVLGVAAAGGGGNEHTGVLWFADDVSAKVYNRTSILGEGMWGEAGGELLCYLLATVACDRASVVSNPETTFSIPSFCCETLVAASSWSFLHPLASCPFSPVQALAALVKSPKQKVSRTEKGKAAYAQLLHKVYVQFERRKDANPLHPSSLPFGNKWSTFSMVRVGAGRSVQSLFNLLDWKWWAEVSLGAIGWTVLV